MSARPVSCDYCVNVVRPQHEALWCLASNMPTRDARQIGAPCEDARMYQQKESK